MHYLLLLLLFVAMPTEAQSIDTVNHQASIVYRPPIVTKKIRELFNCKEKESYVCETRYFVVLSTGAKVEVTQARFERQVIGRRFTK